MRQGGEGGGEETGHTSRVSLVSVLRFRKCYVIRKVSCSSKGNRNANRFSQMTVRYNAVLEMTTFRYNLIGIFNN